MWRLSALAQSSIVETGMSRVQVEFGWLAVVVKRRCGYATWSAETSVIGLPRNDSAFCGSSPAARGSREVEAELYLGELDAAQVPIPRLAG